jgi:hypothetical protein
MDKQSRLDRYIGIDNGIELADATPHVPDMVGGANRVADRGTLNFRDWDVAATSKRVENRSRRVVGAISIASGSSMLKLSRAPGHEVAAAAWRSGAVPTG